MAIHKGVTGFEEKRLHDLDQKPQAHKERRPDPSTAVTLHALSVAASVRPTSVFSPTASKTPLSLEMDYHDQTKQTKSKYIIQKNLRTQNSDFECHCFLLQIGNCFTSITTIVCFGMKWAQS